MLTKRRKRVFAKLFDPRDLPRLELFLWHSLSPTYTTSGGSTPANVGDPVGQWNDLSPYARHFTQSSSSLRPVRQANGIQADATDDVMTQAGGFSLPAGGVTFYFAGARNATKQWEFLANSSAVNPRAAAVNSTTVIMSDGAGTVSQWSVSSGTYSNYLLRQARSAADNKVTHTSQDGTNTPGNALAGTLGSFNQLFRLSSASARNNDATHRYAGVVAYSRGLTASEDRLVRDWLFLNGGYTL